MRRTEFGTLVKFDHHIGHSLTAEAVAAGQFSGMDRGFEAAFRRMNERRELCRMMIERAATDGRQHRAEVRPELGQPRRP